MCTKYYYCICHVTSLVRSHHREIEVYIYKVGMKIQFQFFCSYMCTYCMWWWTKHGMELHNFPHEQHSLVTKTFTALAFIIYWIFNHWLLLASSMCMCVSLVFNVLFCACFKYFANYKWKFLINILSVAHIYVYSLHPTCINIFIGSIIIN